MILIGKSGAVVVVTRLYGPVDDARLAKEQLIVQYRAEQLNPRVGVGGSTR